jgi:Galactose oxidase, central domain/Kelch motif
MKLRSAGLFASGLIAVTAMPAFASGTFQRTGSMNVARESHTSTLLSNGQVLVAGGGNGLIGYLSSAELYNPATGRWALTGSMSVPRQDHQAVRLQNGQVLVAGGDNASSTLASAELYNPSTGTWTTTGSMITARYNFSLTLLPNGEVLAVQGASAELYNPATGIWTATGSPTNSVGGPNATLLQNGELLAIGESLGAPSELYHPSTGTWSATGSTGITSINPITPRLLNGEVFVTSGFGSGGIASYSTAALYDPSTGQFTVENGPCSCRAFNGTLLQTGEVLVAGGMISVPGNPYPTPETINSAELWNLSTQAWTSTGNLHDSRAGESMTVLPNGQVLVAGGSQFTKHSSGGVPLSSAELYTP